MSPRDFTNSTAVHFAYRQWQPDQFEAYLHSMDPNRRAGLAEACPHILQILDNPKSRKGLALAKLCASFIGEGFAASSVALPKRPLARVPLSSHVGANWMSVALGVLCVAGLYQALGPRRASLCFAMKKVS